MSYIVAVAGKGGTGKTTLAGFVVDYLKRLNGGAVLAVDGDPNSNLGEYLGVGITDTMIGIIDDIAAGKDKASPGMTKERLIEYKIQESLIEGDGFDLLVMGRPEGPGCYCYPNSMLREALGRLSRSYKYMVMDNEAGMEHLSRRTTRSINYLFLASDATEAGLRAAKRITDLIKELKISVGKTHLVINKAKSNIQSLQFRIDQLNADFIDYLPESLELADLSREGRPLTEINKDCEYNKKLNTILEAAKKRWR